MYDMTNKTTIVTGGGSGIGRAIARRYASEGARVLIVARHESSLKETADGNPNITWLAGDITDDAVVEEIGRYVEKEFSGKLDVLVNNAGWCPVQQITEITVQDYDKAFSLDVRALVALTVRTLPCIIAAKGMILNMSSVGADHPAAGLSMYIGAKSAVSQFTRVWAIELASKGVRVNAIAPGAIETNIWNVTNMDKEAERRHKENIARSIPMGRFGSADDIASMAAFLASDQASYITGAIMPVDGGQGAF